MEKSKKSILDHLLDISNGRCLITEAGIAAEQDPAVQEILTGLLKLHEDIRRRDEQAARQSKRLMKSDKRFRSAFENTGVGMVLADRDGRFESANRSMRNFSGYGEAELYSQTIFDLIHPGDLEFFRKQHQRLVDEDNPEGFFQAELRFIQKDESIAWARVNVALLTGDVASENHTIAHIEDITISRLVAEKLKFSESRLALQINRTPLGVINWDTDFKIREWNPAAEEIFGYSRAEALGRHACDIIVSPELRERVDQDWRDLIDNRGGDYAVNESTRKDGTGITCEWHNSPLIDEDGGVFGISSFVRDVSRRIANQDALRASEELFTNAFSSSPALVAISDVVTTRVISVNDTWLEFMGMERADVIGKTVAEIGFWAYPEDRLEFVEILEKEGFVRDLEIKVRTNKGTLRDLLIVADVIDFAGKKCLMSVSLDIGERKRTENLEARLGRVVEGSLNGIFIFGAETLRFSLVNKGARENLGYSSIELMNMTPFDIKPDGEISKFETMIEQLHNSWRDEITYETRHQRKDGTIYDASVRLNYLRDEVPPVYIAFVEDITERKIAEESARRSQKIEAIGHLTGGIAHDFNNLLGIILGNLDLLEEDLTAQPDLLPLVDTAQRAALRGSEMTKRLLSFSTKIAPRTISVNINTSIVSMAPLIARSLSPEIEIINELAENLWITSINDGEFEDTILNLSINARKAMPEGGKLTFRTENKVIGPWTAAPRAAPGPGEYVHLTVGDSGTGIAKDIIDNIFDPFFTTDGLGAGTGLGLSMVYGFVERSGGSISVDSEPGQGTVFDIYLPRDVAGETLRNPAADDQSIILGGRETILVVDDEPDLVNLAKGILHRLGYSILTAGNATQAMNILKMTGVGEIDLLFSDIVMPGELNGLELARSAQAQDRNIRILMATGYMQKITDADTYRDITENMLTKPYTRADLALGIRAALDGRS